MTYLLKFATQSHAKVSIGKREGGIALYDGKDVYLTFYLWHTELRNFMIGHMVKQE